VAFRLPAVVGAMLLVIVGTLTAFGASTAGASGLGGFPGEATSIPVLDWHELNNGCAATVAVCDASDPESVSTAQLTAELGYLKAQGYHTVTSLQYEEWAEGLPVALPPNPIFLVADNGIENFLAGAQPILAADGFTMAVAVVTGFADGASDVCSEPQYETECPVANDNGWDATWAQLKDLSPSVYSFILESGTAGHFVQTYDPNCTVFYACELPGESAAAYEARVVNDLSSGTAEILANLGFRFTSGLWVVPYSDDGYTACTQVGCTPQPSDGPAGWLTSETASLFPVAFVEDAFRNGIQHERFRMDVQGWMTQTEFTTMLAGYVAAGDFSLGKPTAPSLPSFLSPLPTNTPDLTGLPVLNFNLSSESLGQVQMALFFLSLFQYHAVTEDQYAGWADGDPLNLPSHPVLITVSGGNQNLVSSALGFLGASGFPAFSH